MTQHLSYALRPHRAAQGMGWLVLVVILIGTILSSIGGTSSHGLAAFQAALHVTPASLNTSDEHVHEHAHEDEGIGWETQSAGVDHPHHHGADHSHDKAHALPVAWHSAAPLLPAWFGLVRPWIEMIQAFRLERPPMG
jgi:hypothetical protein